MANPEQLAASGRARGRGALALWILAPLVGLAIVFEAVASLPSAECGGGVDASVSQELVVTAIAALASLIAFAGAGMRLRALRRAGRAWAVHGTVVLVGLGAVLLTGLAFAFARAEFAYLFIGAGLAGVPLTGIALLGLLAAWIGGRGVDGAGALLPLYLLGAGLFCYPVVLLLGLLGKSGIAC